MTLIPTSEISSPIPSPVSPSIPPRLPEWFKVQIRPGKHYKELNTVLEDRHLHTICEEARCPNRWECWNNRTATFLILGDRCTRRCQYCSVTTKRPLPVDSDEPRRVAESVRRLNLQHAVVTSVNRDDLPDGGAEIFYDTILHIRRLNPSCSIEVLIPDFQGSAQALKTVMRAHPDILNHNIETTPRLFPSLRAQGDYRQSLNVLRLAKDLGGRTKSGLMVGLGETRQEVLQTMDDLRNVECDMFTLGQYLRPTLQHASVSRYYTPEEFEHFKQEAYARGFQHVESGPLVRSSYHAGEQARHDSNHTAP